MDQQLRGIRWLATLGSAEHRCFLGRYEQILSVAERVFGDRNKAQCWLVRPVIGLGHQAPCTECDP